MLLEAANDLNGRRKGGFEEDVHRISILNTRLDNCLEKVAGINIKHNFFLKEIFFT